MITFGSQPGKGEVMPYQVLDQRGIGCVEPDRFNRLTRNRRTPLRVVDSRAGQLSNVMEEAAQ
jgi:hypothetical protein